MSYFAKFFLNGPDAQKAVDWLFTANMQKPSGILPTLSDDLVISLCSLAASQDLIPYIIHQALIPIVISIKWNREFAMVSVCLYNLYCYVISL